MTIKNKKAVITGYYNNDFYVEECFNSNIGYYTIKDLVKERLPIGKEVYVSKVPPACDHNNLKNCPHKGKCYEVAYERENGVSSFTACMIDFKIIQEGELK